MDTIVNNFSKATSTRDETGVTISWKDNGGAPVRLNPHDDDKEIDLSSIKIITISGNLPSTIEVRADVPILVWYIESEPEWELPRSNPEKNLYTLARRSELTNSSKEPLSFNIIAINKNVQCWMKTLKGSLVNLGAGVAAAAAGFVTILGVEIPVGWVSLIVGTFLLAQYMILANRDLCGSSVSSNATVTIGEPIISPING